ncbi:helix-turn-helix transcriptional regulator [Phyllobacterium zundukense]|uniref:HTH araC/xylS-type domain-containing protein n=1 Tax=Phyllobacterium zundukense TaxID=1867719 RepID=A0A2N9VXR8_9HYPH|nr:helix-turn-helix transcriptional regulator [Phyllobacterium zundukense]ATU95712.1 hypothetical protein BLM14_28800 [Phyllobacterium zundukense]PIO44286.1 hypothetical protein B5P45_13520 [Phyllobacterium zundukense]
MSDEIARDFKPHSDIDRDIIHNDDIRPLPERASASKPTRAAQAQLLLAEAYIRHNIYNPINITDIAADTGVNIRALQRVFRKYRQATPIQVIASFRIAEARALILTGQATSVRHLAAKLHFSNPGRFSKLYRTTYSQTPSEDIRACLGET